MSEINLEELSKPKTTRPELEEVAVSLGLADAASYVNKPAVLDAIKRVHEGKEDAATVNAELKPADTPDNGAGSSNDDPSGASNVTQNDENDDDSADDAEDDDDTTSDDENASDAAKKGKKEPRYARNRNQGHPTRFDEQGRPLYRA